MRFACDLTIIKTYACVCTFAYAQEFTNKLTRDFVRSGLEQLIPKLAQVQRKISQPIALQSGQKRKTGRKSLTFTLTINQTFILYFACEIWLENYPESPETYIIKEHFLNRLN